MGPHPVASGASAPRRGLNGDASELPAPVSTQRTAQGARASERGRRTGTHERRARPREASRRPDAPPPTGAQARRRARNGSRDRRSTRRPRVRSSQYAHVHTPDDTKTRTENFRVCAVAFALLYGHIMRLSARQKPLQRPGVLGGAAPRVLPGSPQRAACCVLGPCDTMSQSSGL